MQSKYWGVCSAAVLSPKVPAVETSWEIYSVQHWEDLLPNKPTVVAAWVICSVVYWVEAQASNRVPVAVWAIYSEAYWEAEAKVPPLAAVWVTCSVGSSVAVRDLRPAAVPVASGISSKEDWVVCSVVP